MYLLPAEVAGRDATESPDKTKIARFVDVNLAISPVYRLPLTM